MKFEPLNRRLAIVAAVFAFAGVALGAFALATDYWTIGKINDVTALNESIPVGQQVQPTAWNGLFESCNSRHEQCNGQFWTSTFLICLFGLIFLFVGGVFSAFDVPRATDRRFITPLLIFVACVLMTAGLVDYASSLLLNFHSSRSMVAAVVFAYTALSLSSFIAGRYSTVEQDALINDGLHLRTQKYSSMNGNGNGH